MLKAILAVFIGAASYGILSTIAKLSYLKGYKAEDATVFQIVFGFLVLLTLYLFQKTKINFRKIQRKEFLKLIFGGITIALTSLFYYSSVQYIDASLGIILLFQFIWIGFLLDLIFNKVKPTALQLAALAVLLIGTGLASGLFVNHLQTEINSKGIVLGLLAALSYASFIFINGKLDVKISAVSKSTFMMGVSTVLILLINPPSFTSAPYFELEFLQYGIPLAIFGAVIPPVLYAYGVPKIGVTYSSILSSVELPVAIICSIVLLNEVVQTMQWLGVLLILISIVIVSLKRN